MNYEFAGKKLRIPDKEIEISMKTLGLSKDEAIQLWLEDEGYMDNAEQNELDAKAKEADITRKIHGAGNATRKQSTRTRKENPVKEGIIKKIAEELLPQIAENIEVLNIGKLISFSIGDRKFEINLIEKRKPKK